MSAGRLYDKIGDTADAEVQFVLSQSIICRVNSRSQENKTGKSR